VSADGAVVVFESGADNLVEGDINWGEDIFRHDRTSGETERLSVSKAGGWTRHPNLTPVVSADGHYVMFYGGDPNLVDGDTNGTYDIFVRGPEVTLDVTPLVVPKTQMLTLTEYRAPPGNAGSLWVVAVDGAPTLTLVGAGTFTSEGTFTVSGAASEAASGHALTFRGYAISRTGATVATGDVAVTFE
jgi:hypothetical protein